MTRADEIAVTAQRNEVTLRGPVGGFAEVEAAVGDARGIARVVSVVEELHGWVTLTGAVDLQSESDIAFGHVAGLRGVTGVTNEIEVGRARRTRDRLTDVVAPVHSSGRSRR